MKQISILGVAIGNITDIVCTYAVTVPLMIYVVASSKSGLPPAEILRGSTAFLVWSSSLGAIFSVLGGYVAARIAKHDEVLNGALSSILCIGSGLYALISGSAADHLWLHLLFLPLSPALGAFGGFLRSRRAALQS